MSEWLNCVSPDLIVYYIAAAIQVVATNREQMINLLATTAAAWGHPLSPTQLDQFDTYAAELRRWNERVNLTAIADEPGIVTRHFLDSLRCASSWGMRTTEPGGYWRGRGLSRPAA